MRVKLLFEPELPERGDGSGLRRRRHERQHALGHDVANDAKADDVSSDAKAHDVSQTVDERHDVPDGRHDVARRAKVLRSRSFVHCHAGTRVTWWWEKRVHCNFAGWINVAGIYPRSYWHGSLGSRRAGNQQHAGIAIGPGARASTCGRSGPLEPKRRRQT